MKTLLLLTVISILSIGTTLAQALESKDGKFSLLIPPGWKQFTPENKSLDGGMVLNDNYPLTVFLTQEKRPLNKVVEELNTALAKTTTGNFKTAQGLEATTVLTEKALEQPNTFVYQYYFLFGRGNTTYALICTSGVAEKGQWPRAAFESLAQTATIK